jgi:hypothetical protein
MRRRGVLVAAAVVLVALAAGTAAFLLQRSASGTKVTSSQAKGSAAAPSLAITTIRRLTSADAAVERSALTPELNSVLPPGRLFPAGTVFTPSSASWRQSGAYANATGTIREPDRSAEQVEIGLVLRHGQWFVTFEGQL